MDTDIPTLKAGIFQGYGAFLSRRGVNIDPLVREAGLRLEDISDPSLPLPLEKAALLMERAAQKANDPCLALHWGESCPAGGSGVFGYAIANSANLREAMQAAARYLTLVLYPADMIFTEQDGLARLTWRVPPIEGSTTQYVLFAITASFLRMKQVAGSQWQPFALDFTFGELPCLNDFHRVFGPSVNFNKPVNALVVDSATLEQGAGAGDQRLNAIIRELGERMLVDHQTESDFVCQTYRAIVEQLKSKVVTLDAVAAAMTLTPRMLQSKLAQSNTSFEVVFQETRRHLATEYLRDSDMALNDIAYLLGFSEQSAFTRACQRWFEMAPTCYRQHLRQKLAV
jgi:AraC-like DNA-binding protein